VPNIRRAALLKDCPTVARLTNPQWFIPIHLQGDAIGDDHCQGNLNGFFCFEGKDYCTSVLGSEILGSEVQ
jgi:hypothetical protein